MEVIVVIVVITVTAAAAIIIANEVLIVNWIILISFGCSKISNY